MRKRYAYPLILALGMGVSGCTQYALNTSTTASSTTETSQTHHNLSSQQSAKQDTSKSSQTSTENVSQTADTSAFTAIKIMDSLALDAKPVPAKGYWIAKGADETVHIYDKNGEDVGRTKYASVVFFDTLEPDAQPLLQPVDASEFAQWLDYAAGDTETNNVGGFGGVDGMAFGVDPDTRRVLYKDLLASVDSSGTWSADSFWTATMPPEDNMFPARNYLIHSTSEIDQFDQEKPDTYFKSYYIWDRQSGRIDGPYTRVDNWMLWKDDQYRMLGYSAFHDSVGDMYVGTEDDQDAVIYKGQVVKSNLDHAISVGSDAVFVKDDGGCYLVSAEYGKTSTIALPDNAELCSDMQEDGTIMIRQKGVWALYQVAGI